VVASADLRREETQFYSASDARGDRELTAPDEPAAYIEAVSGQKRHEHEEAKRRDEAR